MFRLRGVSSRFQRLIHMGSVNRDQVLQQLQVCSAEEHVFDVVGKNKAELTADHVGMAVNTLWRFQRDKPIFLRTVELIKNHPQFLTLQVLAEKKIALMDDIMLVDLLYSFLRLNFDFHDPLIQQLVSEAWRRLDKLPMTSLSKFTVCLHDMDLAHSPLIGRITNIVDQNLSSIDDGRILSTFLTTVTSLGSPRFRDALLSKVDHLLDKKDRSQASNARRVMQFLHNIKYNHRPLLEKCKRILLCHIPTMDVDQISMLMGLFRSLRLHHIDFKLAVKQRLTEKIDSSVDPATFARLFISLAPLASPETRGRLEGTAYILADDFDALQVVDIVETLQEIQSRNFTLINKLASVIQRNLDTYRPVKVCRITRALLMLHYKNPKLFTKLRNLLLGFLERSFLPGEVTMLNHCLSLLPCRRLQEGVISRLNAVVPQCRFRDLISIALALEEWMRKDPLYHHSTSSEYVLLLQALTSCSLQRLQRADRLNLLLEELKYVSGQWFKEVILEETMATLHRMIDQIDWMNLPALSRFITKTIWLCPPLMDRIASVAIKDIEKIHPSAIYDILRPFSTLKYDPKGAEGFYDACIKRFTPHISSLDCHRLVLLASVLAVAGYFPEELVRHIFNIDFLGKLEAELEFFPASSNRRIQQRLMELNRAVSLECPEFQVPWFHHRYYWDTLSPRTAFLSPVHQQIHTMLGEVLGGVNCVRAAEVTHYFYTLEFEFILDKHLKPLPFSKPSFVQISDEGENLWSPSSLEKSRKELPPGAQRVCIDFLDSKSFCKNSQHMTGVAVIRRRHLEILGYRVVQIPHFEWNSMELSTQDAWKEYLRKKIFLSAS
ncbi:FAST kinase domain-containing protein 1, mitochondrial [Nerophis ophidion]|uniref:FAST kinase domain-containing protein 1, mitochondrial n=1 Tax=Nerophis ophidion TaxID=159077 RepID=UPI002ADF9E24|nr:FAST kinase domain-containing protein 1, mitochondrial [Nerophis ophidion]XP_061736057.1 FAST kinase domain-containing protein 1, mitochondrial [Nerophis ophidion]